MMWTGKPRYVVQRLKISGSRHQTMIVSRPSSHQLKLSGESFPERAAKIWNLVPQRIEEDQSQSKFKTDAKEWVRGNVPAKIIKS